MTSEKSIAVFRRLREQPVWRLLAAHHGPVVAALLQTHLLEAGGGVQASIFHERVARDLEELRALGYDLPQTAQLYAAEWLREGFIERRFPAGAAEEEYEVSAAAAAAIRFLTGLVEPRSAATESRLANVMQQLVRLAEETDANPESRIATLLAERERLDCEIENIRAGRVAPMPANRALERVREAITLADELTGDFRRVRDAFERLNRELRERILDTEGSRGEVLEDLFAGVDVIASSEEGRTFAAFWRLLTDPEESATLDQALDQVLSRDFAAQLEARERRFLLGLTRTLLAQGGSVHEVMQHLATSLKSFVQSREYLEQRRISHLLREAQQAALALRDEVSAASALGYELQLTGTRLQSLSQWVLFDPSVTAAAGDIREADGLLISLDTVGELVAQSEIDFRSLSAGIRAMLGDREQVSIAEVLERYPAPQGLGSVVGYLALGSRHGVAAGRTETIRWQGGDGEWRRARIPTIYFLKERIDALAG